MPAPTSAKPNGRFVDLSLNLKVAKKIHPLVSEALKAILALAGQGIKPDQATDKPAKRKPGRPAKAEKKTAAPAPAVKKRGRPAKAEKKTAAYPPAVKKIGRPAKKAAPPSRGGEAARLRESRLSLGLSQQTLAAKLGLRQTVVSDLENGKRPLTPELAQRFEQALQESAPNPK